MVHLSYAGVYINTWKKARVCGGCEDRDKLIKRGEKAICAFKYGYERLFHFDCFLEYFNGELEDLKGQIESGKEEWESFKEGIKNGDFD